MRKLQTLIDYEPVVMPPPQQPHHPVTTKNFLDAGFQQVRDASIECNIYLTPYICYSCGPDQDLCEVEVQWETAPT